MLQPLSPKRQGGTRCGYAAIVGRSNVGKSTLFNRMLGVHLSAVTHKRQTTRCNVRGMLSDDKTQLIFIDTPGVHAGPCRLSALLNQNLNHALSDADVLLMMAAAGEYTREDRRLLRMIERHSKPCLLLINKVDRFSDKTRLLAEMQAWSRRRSFSALLPVSARFDKDFSALRDAAASRLPESDFLFPKEQTSDHRQRFIAAELIREQLTAGLNQELPYAVHVSVEAFEPRGRLTRVAALVLVERETQKGIVLGARGERLKRMAARARRRLERFLKDRVYLSLRVQVRRGWQSDPAIIGPYWGDAR